MLPHITDPPSPLQSLLEKPALHFSANETFVSVWAGRVTIKLSLLRGKVHPSVAISYFDITLKTLLVLLVAA